MRTAIRPKIADMTRPTWWNCTFFHIGSSWTDLCVSNSASLYCCRKASRTALMLDCTVANGIAHCDRCEDVGGAKSSCSSCV